MHCQLQITPARPVNFKSYLHLVFVIGTILINGCATTKDFSSAQTLSTPVGEQKKIVLMPLDVELSKLTAGGVLEPNAAWTSAAKRHITNNLTSVLSSQSLDVAVYSPPSESDEDYTTLNDLEKLHGAVGQAILLHKYTVPLATKKNSFDWSLGRTVTTLKSRSDATHALFIFIRDSYSTGGRIFVQLAAAALGVGLVGGQQIGFASLVDLTTGEVVWFNHLHSTAGDLRTSEPAKKTVALLMSGLPK